jgi:hypothetical protein
MGADNSERVGIGLVMHKDEEEQASYGWKLACLARRELSLECASQWLQSESKNVENGAVMTELRRKWSGQLGRAYVKVPQMECSSNGETWGDSKTPKNDVELTWMTGLTRSAGAREYTKCDGEGMTASGDDNYGKMVGFAMNS